MEVNFYEVLDITPEASAVEIKDAYRKAVWTAHPDAGGTAAMFQLVTEAYNTLSDPDTRVAYDAELRGSARGAGDGRSSASKENQATRAGWNVDAEWGEDVPAPAEQTLVSRLLRRFRRWAVSPASDMPVKISWAVWWASYILLTAVLVVGPGLLHPEAAGGDVFSWLTQRWWVTLIAVVLYGLFACPVGENTGGMGLWQWIGALALLAWLPAYSSMASSFDVWIYVIVTSTFVLHHAALSLIEEVKKARQMPIGG